MVSPSRSSGASGTAGRGGFSATKTSPSGVAVRSSTVVPLGISTSERMRIVTTAV
ncbi:Uncharacterised protein [Mycobacteroides abscessus subsp. abscessus]|nr:Uncharacterised protein [Mycobacteroides abscessus subsp. abscessus]